MCARCSRDANLCVSTLVYVLGRIDVTPAPDAVRSAVAAFAAAPDDSRLQAIVAALGEHQMFSLVHDAVRDVELFGGLEAVLEAADREHADNFRSAMTTMKGVKNDRQS